jgi:hypothetical protein
MKLDIDLLQRFEEGLDPQNLDKSAVPSTLLGYGEISTIFELDGIPGVALKRMPLFKDLAGAKKYVRIYDEYCHLLVEAGLKLPESETVIIEAPGRPISLYIAQEKLPPERLAHRLIHTLDEGATGDMIERIVSEIDKVWKFNERNWPALKLAIDGQLSNWVCPDDGSEIYYIDTSTPLYCRDGAEQNDPELLLQSVPGFLRWFARLVFVDDLLSRYYDPRQVNIDLAANLYKEQRPDLIPLALEKINASAPDDSNPLTVEDLEKYYKWDKLIWVVFLAMRRFDCRIKTKLLRQRYEFILPGKIER